MDSLKYYLVYPADTFYVMNVDKIAVTLAVFDYRRGFVLAYSPERLQLLRGRRVYVDNIGLVRFGKRRVIG